MAAPDKRETVMLPLGDLSIVFKRPNPGQLAALRRAGNLFQSEDKATQGKGGLLFLDVLDNLVSDSAILDRVYDGMATETIKLEAYAECAISLLKHFAPGEAAPSTGPVQTTRRRATARPKR